METLRFTRALGKGLVRGLGPRQLVCDRTWPVTPAVTQAATGGGGDTLPQDPENPRLGGIWQCWGRAFFFHSVQKVDLGPIFISFPFLEQPEPLSTIGNCLERGLAFCLCLYKHSPA